MFTDEDEVEAQEDEEARASIRRQAADEGGVPSSTSVSKSDEVKLPPVLQRIFGTPEEDELLAVAKILDARNSKKLTLVFHTPIGDVKIPVTWSSASPDGLHRCRDLLLIMVRSSDSMFIPNPGSKLQISFWEHQDAPRLWVTCLAPPMQLYAGVGIDLLCFLPENDVVEKTGRLKDGAPSVVSGQPSTGVDDFGEPVVEGEKSASARLLPEELTREDSEETEDFDQPRGS